MKKQARTLCGARRLFNQLLLSGMLDGCAAGRRQRAGEHDWQALHFTAFHKHAAISAPPTLLEAGHALQMTWAAVKHLD